METIIIFIIISQSNYFIIIFIITFLLLYYTKIAKWLFLLIFIDQQLHIYTLSTRNPLWLMKFWNYLYWVNRNLKCSFIQPYGREDIFRILPRDHAGCSYSPKLVIKFHFDKGFELGLFCTELHASYMYYTQFWNLINVIKPINNVVNPAWTVFFLI